MQITITALIFRTLEDDLQVSPVSGCDLLHISSRVFYHQKSLLDGYNAAEF